MIPNESNSFVSHLFDLFESNHSVLLWTHYAHPLFSHGDLDMSMAVEETGLLLEFILREHWWGQGDRKMPLLESCRTLGSGRVEEVVSVNSVSWLNVVLCLFLSVKLRHGCGIMNSPHTNPTQVNIAKFNISQYFCHQSLFLSLLMFFLCLLFLFTILF